MCIRDRFGPEPATGGCREIPGLEGGQPYRDLLAQLEGTENRIAVARNRYIKAVQEYNLVVRKFPTNLTAMLFGFTVKPTFSVANEQQLAKPPQVDFNLAPAPSGQ